MYFLSLVNISFEILLCFSICYLLDTQKSQEITKESWEESFKIGENTDRIYRNR